LIWNAGGFKGKMAEGKADDVAFISKLLDDLGARREASQCLWEFFQKHKLE